MNGPVTTAACPNGHASTNRAVCTVCGILIAAEGREAVDTTPTAGAVPAAPGVPGATHHLAAAVPIDPAEARYLAPIDPAEARYVIPSDPAEARYVAPSDPAEQGPDSSGTGPVGPERGGTGPVGPPTIVSSPAVARPPEAGYPPWPAAGPATGQVFGAGAGTGHLCPHCSAELHPGARFCEVCGYDPSTGSLPHVYAPVVRPAVLPDAPPTGASGPTSSSFGTPSGAVSGPVQGAPPVTGRWIATIAADRAYYESHQVGDVQFPLGVPPRTIELPPGPVSIGRRSRSRGTNPAIDLAGPPEDPAVSHTHASLLPSDDGAWKLIDHGSTNGTFVNESLDALAANQPRRVGPGDRVYVGAWTRITLDLHLP
jgi:hypothetical protein